MQELIIKADLLITITSRPLMMKHVIVLNFLVLFVLFSASQADEPRCGPVCYIYCKYGNVLDERGCPLCLCKPKPYPPYCGPVCKIGCPNGLQTDHRGCPICKCRPVFCPKILCLRRCRYGYVKNYRGCRTCRCRRFPYFPRPCPQLRCYRPCPYGYLKDRYGCSTCRCRSIVKKWFSPGFGY